MSDDSALERRAFDQLSLFLKPNVALFVAMHGGKEYLRFLACDLTEMYKQQLSAVVRRKPVDLFEFKTYIIEFSREIKQIRPPRPPENETTDEEFRYAREGLEYANKVNDAHFDALRYTLAKSVPELA